MEARLTLRSKTATKAEKEAAEVDLRSCPRRGGTG